jgi:hypothetical protein
MVLIMQATQKNVRKRKYIIALVASNPAYYQDYALHNFQNNAKEYILGKDCLPHITIAQFYANAPDCQKILSEFVGLKCIQPQFTGISFIKDKNTTDLWWAELSVMRSLELIQLHKHIAQTINKYGIGLINDTGELYRPHLTFALMQTEGLNITLPELKLVPFELVYGYAGDLGQLHQVISKIE